MPLTLADAASKLSSFFDTIQTNVASGVVDESLPLLGSIGSLPGDTAVADPFGQLKDQIVDAVNGAAGGDVAQAIADAINALGLPGISAVKTAAGGVDITLDTSRSFNTGDSTIDIGEAVGDFLELEVNTSASLTAALKATLSLSSDGDLSLADQADPELKVGVAADFGITDLHANLGVADVTVSDADPGQPEFQADFGFDLSYSGASFTVTPVLTASVGLNLTFETTDVLAGLLPDMKGDLLINFAVDGTSFAEPTVTLDNLIVDLGSYIDIVGDLFGDLGKLFNTEGLGTIVDIATEPVPALDSLAHTFGIVGVFDKVGGITGGGDNVITIGDLAAYQSEQVEEILDPWYIALDIITKIRKLDSLAGVGEVNFGGGSLIGGTTVSASDPAAIIAALQDQLEQLGLPDEVVDFLGDIEVSGGGGTGVGPSQGFTFGLFENPADILKILLTNEAVDLVKFDVPPLAFDQTAGGFFPVLGPLGFLLEGRLRAGIDIDIGYDTQGLIDNALENGFFVSTKEAPQPVVANWDNPEALPYLPVGFLDTSITGGAGVGFAGSSLTVNARFGFGLHAYFEAADEDGKFRPGADGFDCIFDPVGGQANVSLNVTIKIGFGPFSIKKNIPLAEAVLADFDVFKCPPPTVVATPLAPGLATAIGSILHLNVGEPSRADQRLIDEGHGEAPKPVLGVDDPNTAANEALNEGYVIALARDSNEDDINPLENPAPTLVAGKLDVHAFGFTQRVDVPTQIQAQFKGGDDTLVIQRDVLVDADVSGGSGSDNLVGGGGRDTLRGDSEDDVLSGGDNDDLLEGGTGDDQLSGGRGGDRLDGGEGIDTVDYSQANKGTGVGVFVTITTGGDVFGHGGEAEGDTLISIESLVGTENDDDFRAGFGVTQNLVFDGGDGDDTLIGGKGQDLLLGGRGADHLNGDDAIAEGGQPGFDGTSYVTSWGAVDIDLARTRQRSGDAEGDLLFSIEAVEGSVNSDFLFGNASANILYGHGGDDVMEGRGGADVVFGDYGNDLIFGGADGDTLDGSIGIDTLSYAHVAGPVTVDLGATQFVALGLTFFNGAAAPDNIVMARPFNGARGISTFENLVGSNLSDTLTGDVLHNRIDGLDGNDNINGDAGFDTLVGGFGGDTLNGGSGFDWVYYNDSPTGVYVDLQWAGFFGTAQGDTYSEVENILSSYYADTLLGDDEINVIDPNISGRAVTEYVDGRGGYGDILRLDYSTVDADIGQGVSGGFDYSSANYSGGSFQRLTASGAATLDTVNFSNIERLFVVGTRSDDTVYGGYSDDIFIMGSGNDSVLAGNGFDVVLAGAGDDFVAYNYLSIDAPPALDTFLLDGGTGIDTLSIDLGGATENIFLAGRTDQSQLGTNMTFSNGAAIVGFERLRDVTTGAGNDFLMQLGDYNNEFYTEEGQDVIVSGLGIDYIDGGYDFTEGLEIEYGTLPDFNYGAIIINGRAFGENDGDLLVLDYSDYAGNQGIVGTTQWTEGETVYLNQYLYSNIFSNSGVYHGGDTSEDEGFTRTDFSNIERLDVIGSELNDYLEGTEDSYQYLGFYLPGMYEYEQDELLRANLRGDDVLRGGGGNDVLIGKSGSDALYGNDGNDVLIGSSIDNGVSYEGLSPSEEADFGEIDTLTGGDGADTFVLGIVANTFDGLRSGYFYASYGNETMPYTNRAVIADFDAAEGDTIQLSGDSSYYSYQVINAGTADVAVLIYHDAPYEDGYDQIIAEIKGIDSFDFDADYVTYVTPENWGVGPVGGYPNLDEPPAGALALSEPEAFSLLADEPMDFAAAEFGALSSSWVQQNGDVDTLKAVLDGATGGAATSLTLNGSADAFGTFDGDPFGLGKGIILSTGRVEDLPGSNTVGSIGQRSIDVPLKFTEVTTASGNRLYRAELTGLDIRSLTLSDSNSQQGGNTGAASGFDIDAIVISRKFITSANSSVDLNDETFLPRLNVLDYSNAYLTFQPGSQRDPSGGTIGYAADLIGSRNTLVDNTFAELGTFTPFGNASALVLGDGGSLGIDLSAPLDTSEPVYLYVGEVGALGVGEILRASITASPDFIKNTGDLSTDLGAQGPEGDTTGLTYTFTPGSGENAFSLDVVLFSEELPEFDGTDLTDLFSIKINGKEIGTLSNGAALSIKNLVYAGSGDLILNAPGTGPLANQIKADAFTKVLTITGFVDPDTANTLTIEVKDGRDAYLDSGLLIKEGSFKTFFQAEAGANLPPEIASPAGEIRIAENTTAVTTVVATDPDFGQTLAYSIVGGADADLFDIDPETGELVFKSAPDYENPEDADGDNLYDVIVGVSDNVAPPLSDTQAYAIRVTNVAETSTISVKFVSENASWRNSFGWYNSATLLGGILFASLEAEGSNPTQTPGVSTVTFDVPTEDIDNINYFMITHGGDKKVNTDSELSRPLKLVQLDTGAWAVATLDDQGNVQMNGDQPNILIGRGAANALFTETSKNGGGVDYASTVLGSAQTPASLASDTADGPGGLIAWEDTAANRRADGSYGRAGDADYNDAVFDIAVIQGKTLNGSDEPETQEGSAIGDVLYGAGGNDTMSGLGGNDALEGGGGNDLMDGGPGNDSFLFLAEFGQDTISGFDFDPVGGQDLLDMRGLGITAGTFDDRVVIADAGADTLVTIDSNPAQTIRLTGIGDPSVIDQSDFLLS